jgi:hypothetical protein
MTEMNHGSFNMIPKANDKVCDDPQTMTEIPLIWLQMTSVSKTKVRLKGAKISGY